ncbi:MAG: diadenylate cyclase CdaA [Bacillota bacterium]
MSNSHNTKNHLGGEFIPPIELPPLAAYVLDGLLILLIAYKIFTLVRGTQAVRLIKGLVVLAGLTVVAQVLKLPLLSWTLEKIWTMAFVALPVIFWPELRLLLDKLGRGRPFSRLVAGNFPLKALVGEIAAAVETLSRDRVGALIVIERETGLKEYVQTGTPLDALVSRLLLLQLFAKNTPLHDGAVIIKGNRVVAAGCYLPLSLDERLARELGTRHRAGIGLSKLTDALVVIVSEETGTVSLAENGTLTRYLDAATLAELLETRLAVEQRFPWRVWEWEAQKKRKKNEEPTSV